MQIIRLLEKKEHYELESSRQHFGRQVDFENWVGFRGLFL